MSYTLASNADRKTSTKSPDKEGNKSNTAPSDQTTPTKRDQANAAIPDTHQKEEKGETKDENGADEDREDGNGGEVGGNSASPASDVESASLIAFPSPSHGHPPSHQSSPDPEDCSHAQRSSTLMDTEKRELVKSLVEILRRDGQNNAVSWLQESLLDAWKVRVTLDTVPSSPTALVSTCTSNQLPLEPLPSYHIHQGVDIPLVAWSDELCTSLRNTVFLQLLSHMGFQVGDNPTCIFPSIPRSWTTNDLLEQAMSLGTAASSQCIILGPGQIFSNGGSPGQIL